MRNLLAALAVLSAARRAGGADVVVQLRWAERELQRTIPSLPVHVLRGAGAAAAAAAPCGVVLALAGEPALAGSLPPGAAPVGELGPQAFAVRCAAGGAACVRCVVVGGDGAGVLYGALHLIDAARVAAARAGGAPALPLLAAAGGAPHIEKRGLKLNAPLDARTPSYCDCGDNAQANIATMWDAEFWPEYFDAMVRMRMNALSIWNNHPFPSLTAVPEFPDIGYDDVMRANLSDAAWRTFNSKTCSAPSGNAGTSPAVQDHLQRVGGPLPLAAKVAFWRNVTGAAAALGIDVIFMTWSVMTALAGHGMPGDATDATAAYTRAATRALLATYPDIAGVGITAGENMTGLDDADKEKWLWEGTGLGVNDAAAAAPARNITLIHRVWQTELSDIVPVFAGLNPSVAFDFAFKYCGARCYTTPTPKIWADARIELPAGSASRFFWNLRNDDIFQLRWGDVEFLRALIVGLPGANITRGFWVGSDGWAWAREFTSLRPRTPVRALEIDKHWLVHSAWGLLGYDPATPSEVFAAAAAARYPEAPSGAYVLAMSANASAVVPLINQFYWQEWDFQWNAETCARSAGGAVNDSSFVTVDDFRTHTPLAGSGMISVQDFVDKNKTDGMTPLAVADALDAAAAATLAAVAGVAPGANVDLAEALGDFTAFAYLGRYYARKIRGAVALERFEHAGGGAAAQAAAVAALTDAGAEWRAYAAAMEAQYAPVVVYSRTGLAVRSELQAAVDNDVAVALAAQGGGAK